MIRIHFFGHEPGAATPAIAQAMGIGQSPSANAAEQGKFDRLFAEAAQHWESVAPDEADVFVLATRYHGGAGEMPAVQLAKRLGKPVVFLRGGDDVTPLPAEYGVLYRESLEASTRLAHEFALPAFSNDFYASGHTMNVRPKQAEPVVGFCGYVATTLRRMAFRLQGRRQKVRGLDIRCRGLKLLESAPGVTTNFVRRQQFWAGVAGGSAEQQAKAQLQVRQEYLQNIIDSDYTLCARGAGNFSFRFYETLSLGRIPLFVNTDCVLPFEDEIDWQQHCVWVEERDLPQIGDVLRDFHQQRAPEEFAQLQLRNRQLWLDYLRPLAAYQQILGRAMARASTAGAT